MQLINLSITTSTVPEGCKISKLKPLYKKGATTDPKNYRPISLLPLISKIYERVVQIQLQSYLDENNILYKYQSGFRKHHSTNTCLSVIANKVLHGFDKGLVTGMILIDLQKAFDTIDHGILLKKLSYIGLSESSITWFKSYLTNRKFQVNIEEVFSTPAEVLCGVPQGSILGPLLFLIYVNDMPESVSCDLYLYADDSFLLFSNKEASKVEQKLNTEFNNLCDWFEDNKLSIHLGEDKTKSILFSRRKIKEFININRGDILIRQHHSVNYLGCILDEDLSGHSMANCVLGKVNSRLKFLYRKSDFLSEGLRRLLCNALIQPHFDFASSAWYPCLTKEYTDKLKIAQNKCVRFCLSLGNRSHVGFDEFEKMKWLPIDYRFKQSICTLVHNFCQQKSPSYMNEAFKLKNNIATTRNSILQLYKPLCKSNGQKSISFKGPDSWNEIPPAMRVVTNLNTFKHKIKTWYLNRMKFHEDYLFI